MEKELLDYWIILYRKRGLIIFIIISAMITAGLVSLFLTPIYESTAIFFVPQKHDVISFLSPSEGTLIRSPLLPEVAEEPHSPYLGILKSKAIRERVIEDFPHKTLNELRSDVDFSLSDEYMMRIYARDTDSNKAAGIANAYVTYLNHLLGSYSLSLSSKNQEMIEKELQVTEKNLDNAKQAFRGFQEENNMLGIEEEKGRLLSLKADFQSRLETAQVTFQEIKSKIFAMKKELELEAKLYVSAELIIGSPLMQTLRKELADVEILMAGLRVDYRESHPDFIVLQNKYDSIKNNIDLEIDRLAKSQIKHPDSSYEVMRRKLVDILVEQERVQASLSAYRITIDNIKKRIMEMPELFVEDDSLRMDIEKYRSMVRTLEMKLEEVKMQKGRDLQFVVNVEEAIPSPQPSFPVLWLNILVAGLLGLVGGVFYSFFLDYLEETRDQRIYKLVKAIEASEKES